MRSFSYRVMMGFGAIVLIGLIGVYRYHSSQIAVIHDYVLPNDNFDEQTMNAINTDLAQYNVAGTQQDHEVYMITGGLGIANPRILSWDSNGNMTFGGNEGDGWSYTFQETSQSPADWYMKKEDKGIGWTNGFETGFKPVPWVLKHTASGMPYYQWDMLQFQTTQFYFKKGSAYIVLKVDYLMNQPSPSFPQGVMSHLVPLGNPVTKK